MNFEQNIQKWVAIDNKLKTLNEQVKELRDKRNELEGVIINYAEDNNLSAATIQISDGKLKFANSKVQTPLTFKFLEKSLGEIIKNEAQVKQIIDYLKENRETKIVPEIKRFSNN